MKRLFLISFAFLSGIAAVAQTTDTVIVKNPSEVVIVKGADSQVISVYGSDKDPNFYFSSSVGVDDSSNVSVVQNHIDFLHTDIFGSFSSRNSRGNEGKRSKFRSEEIEYLMAGFTCGAKEPDGIAVSPRFFSDITANLASVSYYPAYKGFAINAGLDMGYRSVRIAGKNYFAKTGDNVVLAPFEDGVTKQMSALRYFVIGAPVMLSYNIKDFRIMAGIEGDFNFCGRIRTKYRLDGSKYKTFDRDVQLNKLTYSYIGIIQYSGIGIYFRYTPCNVLAKNHGPEFQTYSVGIVL